MPRARLLGSAAAALLLATSVQPAGAVAPPSGRAARPDLEATAALPLKAPLRQHIDVRHDVPPVRQRAWDDFVARTGGRWTASWDRATGVPSRLWGGSAHVPGVNGSPELAEMVARGFLSQHADLLAPGVDVDELELASNHDDGRIRTVGFWQRHAGLRVVGGQISVRFLADRLYLVSSQILPDVSIGGMPRAGTAADVAERARDATARELALPGATASAGAPVILPLVADDHVLGYRVATPVEVDAGTGGRWTVYAEPATGEPLVRVSRVRWADGVLVYDVPARYPGGGRVDLPAARAEITVDGAAATTGGDGALTWGREATVPLVTSVIGPLVDVRHTGNPDAAEATRTLSISPAGTARWSEAADGELDAQLSTFVHTQIAKEHIRPFISDPRTVEFLDEQIVATVNLSDECNAFYTGGTINFFAASDQCDNTGRLADVVYHEFGHGLHDHAIIPGVGLFDGAMSEGASDFLAAIITGDPGMGRGFFYTDEALRHLDEPDGERVWPDDVGEIHQTGIIYGGALWDLRKAAILELGETEGIDLATRLFVATLQRSTDIPSSLIEALAADDDDGDLGNGTPHECLIRGAFGQHGLRTVGAVVDAPGSVAGTGAETEFEVTVGVSGLSAACPGDEVAQVEVDWKPRWDSQSPERGNAVLTAVGGDGFTGAVPLPDPGEVVEYRVRVVFLDGTSTEFPDNPGDPDLELYRGELITLYCHDFEADPFAEGWTSTLETGLADPWEWGPPMGLGGDPPEAYQGENVVGMVLGGAGLYEPGLEASLVSPVIDVEQYSDVRLHYRRWLGVEDGFYDQASIYANGEIAWQNHDSGQAISASTHTRDKQWVFRDVSLSTRIYDGTVQLDFRLVSDGQVGGGSALEFGGWTLDDLCIVADPNAICGDGELNGLEQCDEGDGNADLPDVCRTNCRRSRCGDGIVDSIEECDDGNRLDGDGCTDICEFPREDGGCCSSSDDPTRPIVPVAIVGLALLAMRRRRKHAPAA